MTTWFLTGFLGLPMIFFLIFFIVILPRLLKFREAQKRQREEEKLRARQNKTLIEKEKFELEVMKQKLARDADLEAKNSQSKFCQYCGAKIPAGTHKCQNCGANS